MNQILAQWNRTRRLALLSALLMAGLSGDIHAFAADAQPAAGEAQTPAQAQGHLLTREQMMEGMIEAERLRSAGMHPDPAVNARQMLENWGVQVIGVSYAADGFWISFRFRVVDADKAAPLFDSKIKPYLQSDRTGVKMAVPDAAKIGALRTTDRGGNIKDEKIYTIMFANPAFQVAPGEKVSVVIGDFKAEHMTVQGKRTNMSVRTAQPEAVKSKP